ncbi:MAG: DJ-1/PfpI family protein [Lachnospiraceae bacterium]|nr:DJ-1/PfpI family protein [Lachnospiraceae bacterium]
MKKVYIFLAEGFEEIEALTVVDLLRRAQIEAVTVSIQESKMVKGARGIKVEADLLLSEVKGTMADMLVLPGGMPGTIHLKECEPLMEMVLGLHCAGAYIGAICAAPSILAELGLLDGKKATSYPSFEEQLSMAFYSYDSVVVDGQIVTSRGLGTAIDFALKIIELLEGEALAKEIADSVVYKIEG